MTEFDMPESYVNDPYANAVKFLFSKYLFEQSYMHLPLILYFICIVKKSIKLKSKLPYLDLKYQKI